MLKKMVTYVVLKKYVVRLPNILTRNYLCKIWIFILSNNVDFTFEVTQITKPFPRNLKFFDTIKTENRGAHL